VFFVCKGRRTGGGGGNHREKAPALLDGRTGEGKKDSGKEKKGEKGGKTLIIIPGGVRKGEEKGGRGVENKKEKKKPCVFSLPHLGSDITRKRGGGGGRKGGRGEETREKGRKNSPFSKEDGKTGKKEGNQFPTLQGGG